MQAKALFLAVVCAFLLTPCTMAAQGQAVEVPGTACPYLFQVTGVSITEWEDGVPETDLSDNVQPVVVELPAGAAQVSMAIRGGVDHNGDVDGCGASTFGAYPRASYLEYHVYGLNCSINSLIGFFINDDPLSASNEVQPFFIHWCRDGSGNVTIPVPEGATRLILGVQDAYGWSGNSGHYAVELTFGNTVPTFSHLGLVFVIIALSGGGAFLLRRRSAGRIS